MKFYCVCFSNIHIFETAINLRTIYKINIMNSLTLLLMLIGFLLPLKSISASEQFAVKRGTNLAHWLSQSETRGKEREKFITVVDIQNIALMGFDHVRLPIDEEQMWDENGKRHDDAFQLMTNCIDWCAENNLRIIIDLHILRSHHFNAKIKPLWTEKKEQEKFFDLWRDLSKSLNKYPTSLLAYELMNEAVADDAELWNNLVANAIKAIRKLEPNRTIVVGSNRWQSADTFDELKVPKNDKNILLSFHCYEPFIFSHYNASWTDMKNYKGPIHYPGAILTQAEFDALPEEMKEPAKHWVGIEFYKDIILKKWAKPITKAKQLGLPLYCGEFGIINNTPQEAEADKLRWYQDMIDLFEETGIGYANWNYKSGSYGLVENDGAKNDKLINILTGK